MLAWTIYVSFIGVAILMLLPKANARAARMVALTAAIAGFLLALGGALQLKIGETSIITHVSWIQAIGADYHLAADGISVTLVLLTGLAAIAGILFSWNVEIRAKEFFAFYLV